MQTNAEETNTASQTSEKLIERIKIEGTPFWMIISEETEWNLIMGHWKLNKEPIPLDKEIDYEEQANIYLEANKWDLIVTTMICVNTDINNQKTETK